MKCPFCAGTRLQVLESRVVEDGVAIRRRRECKKCGNRFTTFEKVRDTVLWVIKKSGSREPFDREKVKRGILRAIQKRPVSLELVDEITSEIEREMLRKGQEEIPSRVIGDAVIKRLKNIDKVAWLRFASVYLEFNDLDDFEEIIEKGTSKKK
jgi:transcriptional repressor NrdR